MEKKVLDKLSPELRKLIILSNDKSIGTLSDSIKKAGFPVSAFAQRTLNPANGGSTLQAALWL